MSFMLTAALLCQAAASATTQVQQNAQYLDRLKAELESISHTTAPMRQLQQLDCAAQPEAACEAEAACEPEAATCQAGIAEPETAAECTARLVGEPAGAEPTRCEPSPSTGCAWLVTPETPASCEPATAETSAFCTVEAEPECNGHPGCKWFQGAPVQCEPLAIAEGEPYCAGLLIGVALAAEPATCEPATTAGCAWVAAEPEATACEPATAESSAVCEPLVEPACNGNPGCTWSAFP
jgi:hypothetical protein